ncbi:MAG: lytic transglycosylase domain-containing protein [Oscillospiraceae bacterium]|nr:lytic transglycosylase domain-containing protein [Oscillospiraceae bacterium]
MGGHDGQRRKKKSNLAGKMVLFFVLFLVCCGAVVTAVYFLSSSEGGFLETQYPKTHSELVEKYADQYNLDADLVYAVIRTESSFNAEAISHAGAVGLMQIMPSTFDWLLEKDDQDPQSYTESDLKTPEINIKYGCSFLRILLDEYSTEREAVAAYNAGFVVTDWLQNPQYSNDGVTLSDIPYNETRNYVEKVMNAKAKYKELY